MSTTKFEAGGVTFQVGRLKVKDSLRGLKLVTTVFLPAFAEAINAPEGEIGNAAEKLIESVGQLPELLDLFLPVTQYAGPTGKLVGLEAFVEDVFGGRPDLCVEFIARAVKVEYGGFLARKDVAGLLGKLQAKFSSSPTGSSTTG